MRYVNHYRGAFRLELADRVVVVAPCFAVLAAIEAQCGMPLLRIAETLLGDTLDKELTGKILAALLPLENSGRIADLVERTGVEKLQLALAAGILDAVGQPEEGQHGVASQS